MDFEILIPIAFFFSVVWIIKIISDNRIRNKLIEKGQLDDRILHYFQHPRYPQHLTHLKWGIFFIFIGVAFFSLTFLTFLNDAGKVGLVAIFAGVAFLIYYVIAKQYVEKEEQQMASSERNVQEKQDDE
ncbi:MAG: hypothetical protein D6748_14160 [Calditrichaeota bacterium]|nr:MAG: hypothetical protein D6748_14160 [Calditrichota bacterium]